MAGGGKYVYCIIRCPGERSFADVPAIGGTDVPVHALPHGDLAAVVSDSSVARYETTRTYMLAHERVLERVMTEFTLLPVRFGTVADAATAAEDIRRLLRGREREFRGLLEEMDGKDELGLKVQWRDEGLVFAELLAQNEHIRRLRQSLDGKSPQATHLQRIHLGKMVKDALDRKRSAEAAGVLAPLRRVACRSVENGLFVDRIVANAAFLVERQRQGEFDQTVGDLEAALGHRLLFKYVGPVPPYNFVNIVVNWREL